MPHVHAIADKVKPSCVLKSGLFIKRSVVTKSMHGMRGRCYSTRLRLFNTLSPKTHPWELQIVQVQLCAWV